MTFNYNTLEDLIQSGAFTFLKSHVVFMTDSANSHLGDTVLFLILFFLISAMTFLINLKYSYTYSYSRTAALVDSCLTAALAYQFSSWESLMSALEVL